ncbi:hypothetical protein T492DRAFT_872656 [Pavlovales sp. CCMP2436]|nr:hypothetical protein T492DRAFT_872656 [Pavlovales sp. CCMP2436]
MQPMPDDYLKALGSPFVASLGKQGAVSTDVFERKITELNTSIGAQLKELNASIGFEKLVKLLKPLELRTASSKVINRRALLQDWPKVNLTMRSHKPDAKETGTIFQIALDGVDEGLELAGADCVLRASFITGMLDSAAVEVVRLPSLESVHIWRVMDCVVPLLSHLQQLRQAPWDRPEPTMAKGICARARRRSSGGGYEAQKGGSKNLVDAAARQARKDAGESKYAPAGMRPEWCDAHYEQRALKLAEEAAAGEVAANALVAVAEKLEWYDRQRAGWRQCTHKYEVKRHELRASAQQASARTELVALIAVALIAVVDGRVPDRVVSKAVARKAQRDALKLAAVLLDMTESIGANPLVLAQIAKLEIKMEGNLAILTNDFESDCAAIARKYETPTPAEGSLKEREASLLRSHEASVAVITSESAGFFPVAVWLRLEDGVGEDDNSYDKVLIIMSALQELRQFSTFSAQVNKLVLTVGPPTGPHNLATKRLRAFTETYNLVESMAFFRLLEAMPRDSSRWTNLRAEMYAKAPELVDHNQQANNALFPTRFPDKMGNVSLSLSTRAENKISSAEVYALNPRVLDGSSRLVVDIGSKVNGGVAYVNAASGFDLDAFLSED